MEEPETDEGAVSQPHCPHCGASLPNPNQELAFDAGPNGDGKTGAPLFCPSCGRRVEGWRTGYRASIGGAHAAATEPGGEAPTIAIAPSPSLLRAAIAAQAAAQPVPAAQPEVAPALQTDRVAPLAPRPRKKKGTSPLGLLAMVLGPAALAFGALLLLGRPHQPPPPAPVVPPVIVNVPTLPDVAVTPAAPAPPVEVAKPMTKPDAPKPVVLKNVAPKIVTVTKEPAKSQPKLVPPPKVKVASGLLPHKTVGKTDSRKTDSAAQPSGTGAPPPLVAQAQPAASNPPPLVSSMGGGGEAAPQTPAQLEQSRRAEGAGNADAASVRFVVQSHLPQVQACYSRAFKDTAPGGRLDIGFSIGQSGRASKIRTESNGTHSASLSSCIEHLIGEWQFAKPASGEFELIYPFVFSPGT